MATWLKDYGTVEGPFGFPLAERTARQVETLAKSLPKGKEYEYRRHVKAAPPTELSPGSRTDVSWISTEVRDRAGEVVLSRGMNDSQYAVNPIVTLNHSYYNPSVGRSLWRKRVKDGDLVGIKAKTEYPAKPASWPETETWPADKVFAYVQAGLMVGKSIGFLPLKVHFPDDKEAAKQGWPSDTLVIDEWLLLEYAVCALPCNQASVTEAVSKAGPLPAGWAELLGLKEAPPTPEKTQPAEVLPFTTWEEVERIVKQSIRGMDLGKLVAERVRENFERAKGRV